MPELGSLWWRMGIKDFTDADIKKINDKLKNLGSDLLINPKLAKSVTEILPKGIKLELEPQLKAVSNEALAKAVEGKVMKVEIAPLLTNLRKALKDATRDNPPEVEVGVQAAKLRRTIESVLNKQGFMLNISTVNDNYSKVVQQKLNGTRYTVKIHADAKEITRSVQASLMQVQSRAFGLQISRDILYRSIDDALGHKRFTINVAVQHEQARKAVQDALLRAQVIGKDQALAYQRLQTGELKAAQAEILRLKAAHMGAADAAKAHATASINLGGALGRNITIAGELSSAMASLYSVHAAKEFLSQVIEIGGELEHQKIAMDTIFGDKGKTSELFGQIKGLARQSPFGVMELTKSVKALSAYGVQYNEIYDTAKRLADISAATSVDINRLILAFGKTKSRGFLDGLEAKQFAYANIPIYEMVRRKLEELEGQAVTTAQVMERMKKREIGFDIVKDVLWDMTDEGGKFYNMQEALAGSVKTSWKLVRDNIELMFGEIAESAVGSSLKSLAEILQGLTREWRTVGTVVGTAAVGLGVYKVATIGLNQAITKETSAVYASLIGEKQKAAQRLKTISLTSKLTAVEKEQIATANKLTNTELAQAISRKKLTLNSLAQLYATKALTKEQIIYLFRQGLIDKAAAKAILSNNRYIISLKGLGMAMSSVGNAAKALLLNRWAAGIAAITVFMGLWQRNSEQMENSKELGDNLFTRATESAKNLKQVLTEVGNEVEKLTDIKIAEAISKLETAIKDYSPTPDKTLREARVDDSGNLRSSQEYVKALRTEVEAMEQAADLEEKIRINDLSKNAMDNAKSGWFDDNLLKDLQDYVNAYADADKQIGKYLANNKEQAEEMVAIALKADPAFKKEAESLESLGEKFTLLAQQQTKFSLAWDAMSKNFYDKETGYKREYRDILNIQLDWGNVSGGGLNAAKKEAFAELEQYMGYVKEALERKSIKVGEGVDMSKPVQIMLANLGNSIFENIKNLPQDRQDELKEMWRTFFGLDFDDTVIFGDISENSKKELDSLGKDLADKLRNGAAYDELSDAEKEAVKKLITDGAQQTEKEMPHLTEKIKQALEDESFIADIAFTFGNYAGLDEWKQELIKIWGDGPEIVGVIKSAPDVLSAYKALAELKKETDDWLTKFGLVKLPVGFTYQPGKLFSEEELNKVTDPVAKQLMQDANSKIGIVNDLSEGQKTSGVDLSEFEKNKNKGNKKDPFAESLKQRFKDIKDAWSEFQKWSKTEGREAAATRIGESGLFSTLSADKIPQTVEEYRALVVGLENELRQAGVKGTARESLLNDLLKQLLDIDKTVVDEQLNKTKEKIDATIKDLTRKWDFHKQLFELTGDRETSVKLAFGEDVAWQTQSQMLESILNTQLAERGLDVSLTISDEEAKEKLEGTPLYDLLWKPAKEAKLKEEVDLQINVAKAVADAASTADKIKVQEGLRDTAVKEYRASEAFKEYGEEGAEAVAKPFNDKILELKSTMLQLLPVWEQIFGDREYASMKQLEQGMNAAQGIIDNAKIHYNKDGKADYFTSVVVNDDGSKQEIQGNISLLEKLRKAVVSLNKEAGKLNPFKRLADTLKEVFSKPKDGKKGDDPETKLRKLGAAVSEVADMTGSLAGQLAEAFDAIGNDGMAQAMTDVQDVMNTVSNIGKGFAEGGLIGGIAAAAGEAIGWVTKAFQASARHKEALQAIMNETLAQQREYNLLLMQQNLEYKKASTIFGEDAYGKAKNAVKVMKDAYADLDKELGGTQSQKDTESKRNFISRIFGVKDPNAELRQAYAGLADIEVKTGHKKTGLFGWGKGKDIYSSILDVYPDLIDANGKFNSSLAETIINTRVMSDEDKAALQNMIDLAEQAEAAYEELNSYMTDIFGELGSSITDALVSAFVNGTDAAEAFYDSVSDMLETLVKQMIYSVTLAPIIAEAQEKMMEIAKNDKLSDEEKLEAWTDVLDGVIDDALEQQGIVDKLIENAQEIAEKKDPNLQIFKPDKDSSKSGLSAGIQGVTEDTADLLASYLNAIRADVAMQTGSYWTRLLDDALPQMNVIAQSQLDTQHQIAENTLRNAVAAEAIVKSNDDISRLLTRVTQGGAKFYVN